MIESIKKYVGWAVAAVLGILYLMFRIQKKRAEDAESALSNAEADKRDAVLEEKQKANQDKIDDEIKRAEEEKGRKLSKEEMEDFLKKI